MMTRATQTFPSHGIRKLFLIIVLTAFFAGSDAIAQDTRDISTHPDLTPIPGNEFDQAQWLAGTEFSSFSTIYIEPINVSFRKNWQREQNRYDSSKVRDKDVERIKQDTAALLHEILLAEFTENGFSVAETPGPGVLVLTPSITKLDIIAPDTPTASRRMTYSEYSGEMTLNVEITDGLNGAMLATVTDRQRDFRRGYLEWRTRVNNRAVARRWMRSWAESVRTSLIESNGSHSNA